MKLRLPVMVLLLVVAAGCATAVSPPTGGVGSPVSGASVMDAEPALSGALIFECRTKCSVSPGPGCC